jgi:hypothetical protein
MIHRDACTLPLPTQVFYEVRAERERQCSLVSCNPTHRHALQHASVPYSTSAPPCWHHVTTPRKGDTNHKARTLPLPTQVFYELHAERERQGSLVSCSPSYFTHCGLPLYHIRHLPRPVGTM